MTDMLEFFFIVGFECIEDHDHKMCLLPQGCQKAFRVQMLRRQDSSVQSLKTCGRNFFLFILVAYLGRCIFY